MVWALLSDTGLNFLFYAFKFTPIVSITHIIELKKMHVLEPVSLKLLTASDTEQ